MLMGRGVPSQPFHHTYILERWRVMEWRTELSTKYFLWLKFALRFVEKQKEFLLLNGGEHK